MLRFFTSIIFVTTLVYTPLSPASGVQNKILSLILKLLNDELNGKLDAESFEFEAPSTIIFNKVIVTNNAHKQLLRAPRLKGTLRLRDLFSGTLNFEEIEATAPVFNLEIVNGDLDVLALFESKSGPSSGKSAPLRFQKVRMQNGTVFLKDGVDSYEARNLQLTSRAFDTDLKSIGFEKISGLFKIGHLPISAQYTGGLSITGIDSKQGTTLVVKGTVTNADFFERKLDVANVDSQLLISQNILYVKSLQLVSSKLGLSANGNVNLSTKKVDALVGAHFTNTGVLFPELNAKWTLNETTAQARLSGPINAPLIQSTWKGEWQGASLVGSTDFNFASKNVKGELKATKVGDLDLSSVIDRKVMIQGSVVNVAFFGTTERLKVNGTVGAANARAPELNLSTSALALSADLDVVTGTQLIVGDVKMKLQGLKIPQASLKSTDVFARLDGTLNNLFVTGNFSGEGVHTKWAEGDSLSSDFAIKGSSIHLSKTLLAGKSGSIELSSLDFDTKTNKIEGTGSIEQLDLFKVLASSPAQSRARLNGSISIFGSLREPGVAVDGKISDFILKNEAMGNVEIVATYGKVQPGVLQISASANGEHGKADLLASYDQVTDRIRAHVEFDNIEFDPVLTLLNPWIKFGTSKLSGILDVGGFSKDPSASLSLVLNADRADPQMNLLGMQVGATLEHHKLSFGGCANVFRQYQENEPCQPSVPIKIKGEGTFRGFDDFTLNYNALVESGNFEKISDFLRKESMSLDLKVELVGSVEKKPGLDVVNQVTATVERMYALLPDSQPMENENPFVLRWTKDGVVIEPEAHFIMFGGDFLIGGQFTNDKFQGKLEGKIPIYLVRLLNRNVVETSGMASGSITLSGNFDNPIIKGVLKPDKASSFRLRALPASVEFRSGEIRMNLASNDGGLIRVEVDKLKVRVGNGSLTLDGTMDFNRFAENQEDILSHIDVVATGRDIGATLRDFAIEGDIDFKVKTEGNIHWIKGASRIVSGKFFEEFRLDGFEVKQISATGNEMSLPPFFSRFKTDIAVDLASFDLDADFGPFEFSGVISGSNLRIGSDLVRPRIFGSIDLLDGVLKFPAADFDIPTTPILLRDTPGKLIDPYMEIKAVGELLKEYSGLTQNTTVELTFKRDIGNLRLDIEATSGERNLGKDKILGILLNMNLGPEILLRPLIAKIEQLLKTQTRTRFRMGSTIDERGGTRTTVNWRLNSRLELGGSTSTKDISLENEAHFKLKLFDHLPIGKEVSLEGIFSFQEEGSQKLQLNYRLFEK